MIIKIHKKFLAYEGTHTFLIGKQYSYSIAPAGGRTKGFASDFSFTPSFSWVSGTFDNLKPFERFLGRRNPLKRFREFASTVVTYLKIGVNKKRARQREPTVVISPIRSDGFF